MCTSPGRPERELNHRLKVSHTGCMISDWVRAQATGFAAVQGRIVRCWSGVEMAVHDGEGLEPGFGGADVPCLQLWALRAVTADDAAVGSTTYQDNDLFGLDESVLAFTDPDALAQMSWMPTRGPLRRIT
jgi:hypothetical protein